MPQARVNPEMGDAMPRRLSMRTMSPVGDLESDISLISDKLLHAPPRALNGRAWSTLGNPQLEAAYRAEYLKPCIERSIMRCALVVAPTTLILFILDMLNYDFSFRFHALLSLSTLLLVSVSAAVAMAARRWALKYEVCEAVVTAVLCVLYVIPLAPLVPTEQTEITPSAKTIQLLTVRFALFVFFPSVFLPVRPRRFAVATCLGAASVVVQELVIAPGTDLEIARTAFALVLMLVLATMMRAHVFDLHRSEWIFLREVRSVVHERTSQQSMRTQQELELAKVQAAKQARSKLIRLAMHNLRSPLMSVHSLADALDKLEPATPVADERVRDMLASLVSLTERMESITSDMLDFESIDDGRVTLAREPFALNELLLGCYDTFAGLAASRRISLELADTPAELGWPRRFLGDVTRLQQVLNNGLSNALKFTPEGGGSVRVSIELNQRPTVDDGWWRILVTIVDQGRGIEPDELRVLQDGETFAQVGAGQLQGNGGTGLGLSISREILKLHGGSELRVASEGEGKGATFEAALWLQGAPPAASSSLAPQHKQRHPSDPPSATGATPSSNPLHHVLDALASRSRNRTPQRSRAGSGNGSRAGSTRNSSRILSRVTTPFRSGSSAASEVGEMHSFFGGLGRRTRGGARLRAQSEGYVMAQGFPLLATGKPAETRDERLRSEDVAERSDDGSTDGRTPSEVQASSQPIPARQFAPAADGGISDDEDVLPPPRRRFHSDMGGVGIVPPPQTMLRFPPGFCCLHVDDDKFVQMTLPLSTFALIGAAYEQADNGEEALRMAAEKEYAFILMDNQMPVMNGTEATRELRARGFKGPIIGITGDPPGCDDRVAFEQAGLNMCVDKSTEGKDAVLAELRKFALPSSRRNTGSEPA